MHCLMQDLADLERRAQGAELRHQELAAKLPDATRPLLRQIEAMQVNLKIFLFTSPNFKPVLQTAQGSFLGVQ